MNIIHTQNIQQALASVMSVGFSRAVAFKILAGALLGVSLLYVFLIASTTSHIAERKDIQSEIRLAHSRIADLEAEFFTYSSQIDLSHARELGYIEATDIAFLERVPAVASVAFYVE